MEKAALRRFAKSRAHKLDLARFAEVALPLLAEALEGRSRILIYHPLKDEPDPRGLTELLPRARFFLPKVSGEDLLVLPFEAPLVRGELGVMEPSGADPVPPDSLDAVVVPALLFDRGRYRLGRGKGYYDRFLKGLPKDVLRVGFLPSALVVERLPRDPWDEPVDLVVTEEGVF